MTYYIAKMKSLLVTLITFCALVFTITASAGKTPIDNSIAPMLQKVLPAIVNIKAQIKITDLNTLQEIQKQRQSQNKNNNGNQQQPEEPGPIPDMAVSVGSGVIVDAKNGYILTNAHVVSDAQIVTVTLSDSRRYTAKIVGVDKASDVALLQIKGKLLTAIPLGDSNNLKVGDFVAAIGNPFGLSQTVTSGIVSALGRNALGIENYENFIQTDAPINPGNSGGALINMQGQLVGINTAILAPDRGSIGIGFAIPANMAKSVMDQLIKYGDVKRGLLGIGAQDITPELANAFNLNITRGAAITQVLTDSPAHQAGLQVGDIIISVNGSQVKNAGDVVNTIGFLRVDTKTNIEVLRNNKQLTMSVTLSDPKKRRQIIEQLDPFLFGVGLKDFTLFSPVYGNIQAVLVVSVEPDTLAWNSDLRPGDIITSVNQQKTKNIEELKATVAKGNKMLLLNIIRGPGAIFLVINREEV